jgi:PPK2 family polyphosphate:nucleotide phosphotransferase
VASKSDWTMPAGEALRAAPGFDLSSFDRASTPGWTSGKKAAERRLDERGDLMSELQEKLFAHGRTDGTKSVLLVLQGMDTAGKGGIVRHVIGQVDPQGVSLTSFGVPTEEEKAQHYLWRIKKALPRPGQIGVFDRSHYEDVLVVKVEQLVAPDVIEPRYDEINAFEADLVAGGTSIVKVALMVSQKEQGDRLARRLRRPDKYWKYNPTDIDAREKWPAYQDAYQAVFSRTSTEVAPWFVVPADHKWYARLATCELLTDAIDGLGLDWPKPDFDVAAEKARLKEANRLL